MHIYIGVYLTEPDRKVSSLIILCSCILPPSDESLCFCILPPSDESEPTSSLSGAVYVLTSKLIYRFIYHKGHDIFQEEACHYCAYNE